MRLFSRKVTGDDKPLILVVEDNERQSKLITQIINETDLYRALTAYNGYDAFEILTMHQRGFDFLSNKIACILLDWQMPRMHGEQFLTLLREKENKSPFKRHIPVVIISAYGDSDRRMLAEDSTLGLASAYLLKPFEEAELLNVLKRIVINKEAEILRELLVEQRSRWIEEFRKQSGRH
ncbi:MAG: response regulator [Pseudomonadales bacterium]|nr:response regulator [Pseudomonadales bacterium]